MIKNILAAAIIVSASAVVLFAADTNQVAQCPMKAQSAQCCSKGTNTVAKTAECPMKAKEAPKAATESTAK